LAIDDGYFGLQPVAEASHGFTVKGLVPDKSVGYNAFVDAAIEKCMDRNDWR
jgi:hypothetical protein